MYLSIVNFSGHEIKIVVVLLFIRRSDPEDLETVEHLPVDAIYLLKHN